MSEAKTLNDNYYENSLLDNNLDPEGKRISALQPFLQPKGMSKWFSFVENPNDGSLFQENEKVKNEESQEVDGCGGGDNGSGGLI